jgi:hypothetical protein
LPKCQAWATAQVTDNRASSGSCGSSSTLQHAQHFACPMIMPASTR